MKNEKLENKAVEPKEQCPEQQEDDWLDTSKACKRDDPECDACQ